MTNRWEEERSRGMTGRTRVSVNLVPERQNPDQIEGRSIEYPPRIDGEQDPKRLAARVQGVFDRLVTSINDRLRKLSIDIGALVVGQQSAVEGPKHPRPTEGSRDTPADGKSTDNAVATWDGTDGSLLQDTNLLYNHVFLPDTIPITGKFGHYMRPVVSGDNVDGVDLVISAGDAGPVVGGPPVAEPDGGDIWIASGVSTGGGTPGQINLKTPNQTLGSSGGISLITGTSHALSSTGVISLTTGAGAGTRGDITLTSDDVVVTLGDASGVKKLFVKDSAAVEVFAVDSDGNVTTSGTVDGVDIAALDAAVVKDGEAAGGALAGTYPSPTLAADAVDAITEIAAAIKVGTGSKLQTADAAAASGTTARFTADGKLEGDLPMANRIAYVSGNVTISGGVLTLPAVPSGYTGQVQWNIQVDPESGTTDELDSISGGLAGDFIHLNVRLAGNTITVKHATGLIHLDGAADKVLNNVRDSLLLRRQSTFSNQISFSDNA